jgi:UDP-N-acetylmuramate--alanine ligase
MDADHLDIYGTSEAIESFVEFASKIEDKSNHNKELPLEGVTVNEDAFSRLLMLELEMVAMF